MTMLNQLLRFVLDREPVAAAAGFAGLTTATIGVLAAWDVWDPTPEQVAAIAALVTAAAGWMARKRAWAPDNVGDAVLAASGEAAVRFDEPQQEHDA